VLNPTRPAVTLKEKENLPRTREKKKTNPNAVEKPHKGAHTYIKQGQTIVQCCLRKYSLLNLNSQMAMEHTSMKCFRNRSCYNNVSKLQHYKQHKRFHTLFGYTVTMHITMPLPRQRQACILAHFDGKPNKYLTVPLDDCHRAGRIRQHVVCHASEKDPAVPTGKSGQQNVDKPKTVKGHMVVE
jgi:hypothetical protein